ncbi:hypothetical protein [Streptomyces ipomoeae]|uniref:hypothetical protein n=1 Tax=Streptomyces ipomoeae TaxID=103232 RepID=UPI001FD0D761|nr:hypothetical protein [Streptomyces ipomoeae]MDX2936741.1 hypothetical protein [Streptomyces ipomoeae]
MNRVDEASTPARVGKLEAHAVFKALATRVERIELTGEPVRVLNNITRGFSSVPVRVR